MDDLEDSPPAHPVASHVAIAYSSARVFATDGRLDLGELELLLALALEDRQVTEAERGILRQVFDRAEAGELDDAVRRKIAAFRSQYRI